MKTKVTLIAAGLALALLGGTAAEARGFDRDYNSGYRNGRHATVNRDFGRHNWNRGDRLSHRYGRYSAVNDWGRYNLRRPPRGYHWVRHDNDFILAALATGLIADIILNSGGGYGRYGY